MKKFSLVIAVISIIFMVSCGSSANKETTNESTNSAELVEASFEVSGNCNLCKDRIEKAATGVQGVETAIWDKDTKQLKISYTEGVNIHSVHQAITAAGHDTEMHKAEDEVYNNLPSCCKYREENSHE